MGVQEGVATPLLRNEGGDEEEEVWAALAYVPCCIVVREKGEGEGRG
jgi:hypothetical protein